MIIDYKNEVSRLNNIILDLNEEIKNKNKIIKKLYLEIEDRNCIIIIFGILGVLVIIKKMIFY
jgi:hypothetical protein